MKNTIGADLGDAMPKITEDTSTEPTEMETKEHMHHLVRAHEIASDPVKMKAVHKMVGRHAKAIKSISDIKNYAQAKFGPHGAGASKSANRSSMKDNEPDADDEASY